MLSLIFSSLMGLLIFNFWGEVIIFFFIWEIIMLVMGSGYSIMKVGYYWELDAVSLVLVMLSSWVIGLSLLASMYIKLNYKMEGLFLVLNLSLFFFLLLSFIFSDYLMFYIGFESCLIPILLLILGWGYQPERSQAGIYMLFYTLFGSFPLFFLIFLMKVDAGSSYMYIDYMWKSNFIFHLFLISAFLVKFPMYCVHLWLLKAHVEAPVCGSMILAGVLLKLGGYGLIRFLPGWNYLDSILMDFLVCFSLWGGIVISLICLRQMDMKLLIASSSVVHMSSCIAGLFIMSDWGMKGCVVMMIAHGLCSSGLFFLANLVYERTNSRSMMVNKGLLNIMPGISLFWFFLVMVNMAAPPSINLLAELALIISIISWSWVSFIFLFLLSFFSGCYSIFLYSLSQHGSFFLIKSGIKNISLNDYFTVFMHWIPLNLLIMCWVSFI